MHVCKCLIHDTQIDNIPMAALYSSVTCFIKAGFPFYQIWMFYEGFKVSLVETLRNLFSSQPAGDLWLLFTLNLMRITDINTWCTKIQQGPLSLASSSLHRLHLFLFFFFFHSYCSIFFFFWWKIAWGKSSLTNHDVPLSSTAETDPLPCSESLDATLKFYWDSYWVGRETEAFLLSGFSSRLFTVWMEDERKARRKKAVKRGLQEERGEWERTGWVCALIKAKYTIKS